MNDDARAIPFNRPCVTGNEAQYVSDALRQQQLSGDGPYAQRCHAWFEKALSTEKALLTPSCTHALELAALLSGVGPGDEVLMPSFTFVSTANAFVLRGARVVFVDVDPLTMNMDTSLLEAAITEKTRAIVPVHYAGVGCDMQTIMALADHYRLLVIEDAAQGVGSTFREAPLGTIGHLGAFSFHETKNYTSGGEGGLLCINDPAFIEKAEVFREKGTNRNQFFRGAVDKYTWIDVGSSLLPSELQAAYLWGQLEEFENIRDDRLKSWHFYMQGLHSLSIAGLIEIPFIPPQREHNGHIFYVKVRDLRERTALLRFLAERNIMGTFHYVPLHTSPAGRRFGTFHGDDLYTTAESERLIRLPMWYGMPDVDRRRVVDAVLEFYR